MYGEVYVQYTPIGGNNMSRSMMRNDTGLTGSSGKFEDDVPYGVHVSWSLPGGINNHNTWGFLIDRNKIYTDEDVQGMITGLSDEEATQRINNIVYDYVHRVLNYDGQDPNYDWGAFKNYFSGCVTVY